MRPFTILLVAFSALLLSASGCEKRIPKEELGNVVFELPKVPGAEKPLEFPQLDGVVDSEEDEDAHHHGHGHAGH